jgi:hypothetical protein
MIHRLGDTFAIAGGNRDKYPWFIAGVHGDEPAPVVALASRMQAIQERHAFVIIPMANPTGLATQTRYGNRGVRDGFDFTGDLRLLATNYPPALVLDLHEDDGADIDGIYVYYHGYLNRGEYFLTNFRKHGIPIMEKGRPRFHDEAIQGGLVIQNTPDNSIDDLLYNSFKGNVLVVETPTKWPFDHRVGVHQLAIDLALKEIWP